MRLVGLIALSSGAAIAVFAGLVIDFRGADFSGWLKPLLAAGGLAVLLGVVMVRVRRRRKPPDAQRFALAVQQGELRRMQRMLDSGRIDPNGFAPNGMSWLRLAAERGDLPQFQVLLGHGADPQLKDRQGMSVIEYLQQAGDGSSPVLRRMRALCDSRDQMRV